MLLDFGGLLEALHHLHVVKFVRREHVCDLALFHHEDQEVEEGLEVISPRGDLEAEGVIAGKHDVASEEINVALADVLTGLVVPVLGEEAKIDKIDVQVSEGILFISRELFLELLLVEFKAGEDIIKLEIVVDVTSFMNVLELSQELDANFESGISRHLVLGLGEQAVEVWSVSWHYIVHLSGQLGLGAIDLRADDAIVDDMNLG